MQELIVRYRHGQGLTQEELIWCVFYDHQPDAEKARTLDPKGFESKLRGLKRLEGGKSDSPQKRTCAPYLTSMGYSGEQITQFFLGKPLPNLSAPEATVADSPQPVFEVPKSRNNIFHYQHRLIEKPLGRDQEWQQLCNFLSDAPGFQWLQIAGVGGQGKSRLAWELITRAHEMGWAAGPLTFQPGTQFDRWQSWQPNRPHLLIVDYVVGREPEIKTVLDALKVRSAEFQHPVRLLFVERQPWDGRPLVAINEPKSEKSSDKLEIGGLAEWFIELADDDEGEDLLAYRSPDNNGQVFLKKLLPRDLVDIVRQVAAHFGTELTLESDSIAAQLEHIDKEGRPLYAYFLGKILADDPSAENLNREGLLDKVIERDFKDRWKRVYDQPKPALDSDPEALKLAVIATMAQGVDSKTLASAGIIPHPDSATRRTALVITDGDTRSSAHGVIFDIPPLLPDILGEWFVLSALDHHGLCPERILQAAQIKPKPLSAFMQRLTQDFFDHRITQQLLNIEINPGPYWEALKDVAVDISRKYINGRQALPGWVITLLEQVPADKQGEALALMGVAHFYGLTGTIDYEKAFAATQKAAQANNITAMHNLGIFYHNGFGVEQDLAKGTQWFIQSAEAGYADAMDNLGSSYRSGQGIEKDLDKAFYWFSKGAQSGSLYAMNNLAQCYETGLGVAADTAQARYWYEKAADQGFSAAMINLAKMFEQGSDGKTDLEATVHWLEKAAATGDSTAMYKLGNLFERHHGPDYDQAERWYKNADAAGHPDAKLRLGLFYSKPEVAKPAQAEDWFTQAAHLGDVNAMAALGYFYCHQNPPDRANAIAWYSQAAKAKHAGAVNQLVELLLQGDEADQAQGLYWLEQAAETGNTDAMYNLGVCYQNGQGVAPDLEAAYRWYEKATQSKYQHKPAQDMLRQLKLMNGLVGKTNVITKSNRLFSIALEHVWYARPPLSGDWQDLTNIELEQYQAALNCALDTAQLDSAVAHHQCNAVRRLPLSFYPGFDLLDIQWLQADPLRVKYCCVLAGARGGAVLEGHAHFIHAFNPQHLDLTRDEAAPIAYLNYFCAFDRQKKDRFQLVTNVDELNWPTNSKIKIPETLRQSLHPIRYLSGQFNNEGWQRYQALVLWQKSLLQCEFNVHDDGEITMEASTTLFKNLPVSLTRYQGAFR